MWYQLAHPMRCDVLSFSRLKIPRNNSTRVLASQVKFSKQPTTARCVQYEQLNALEQQAKVSNIRQTNPERNPLSWVSNTIVNIDKHTHEWQEGVKQITGIYFINSRQKAKQHDAETLSHTSNENHACCWPNAETSSIQFCSDVR